MVFIHGGFTTHESFMKQFNLLPDKRRIFVDLPGCGKSKQKDFNGFSFESAAFEVIKLIEKLSPNKKVILIAHSYDELVVKEVLIRIPQQIDKIVVGNPQIVCLFLYAEYDIKEIRNYSGRSKHLLLRP